MGYPGKKNPVLFIEERERERERKYLLQNVYFPL